MCAHNLCLEQNYENNKNIQPKNVIFTAVKNCCILLRCLFRNGQKLSMNEESIDKEMRINK